MTEQSHRLIFLVQTHTPWGGMELWVEELSEFLTRCGWSVFAGLAKGQTFSDPARYLKHHPRLDSVIMDATAGTDRSRLDAVTRAIRKTDARIAIPVGIGAAIPAARHLKASGEDLRLVVPLLSMFPDSLANVLDYQDSIDSVVVNARLLQNFLSPRLADPTRLHYAFQGVRRAVAFRSENAGPLRAGFVGRFEQESKRVFDLAALEGDLGSDSSIVLHAWGEGPDRAELSEMLQRTVLHGYRTKEQLYAEAYPALDVVLLFSETEGSPNAIWEAMQHGVVPVVSEFLGQASEGMLRHGQNALTFPVGDTAAAARHLHMLAADRDLLRRLSQQARLDIAGWSDTAMYERWCDLLMDVSHRPPVRPSRASDSSKGPLERLVTSSLADRLRSMMGRQYRHPSGWGEWPGTVPLKGGDREFIEAELRRLERRAEASRSRATVP